MMDYINPPELRPWTEDDIRREFARIGNRRKVAKIYGIPLREVNRILNDGGKNGEVNMPCWCRDRGSKL